MKSKVFKSQPFYFILTVILMVIAGVSGALLFLHIRNTNLHKNLCEKYEGKKITVHLEVSYESHAKGGLWIYPIVVGEDTINVSPDDYYHYKNGDIIKCNE
jgi:hypothetical protein